MEINALRQAIDMLDQDILELLARRFEIAQQMGELKQQNHLPLHQPQREAELLNARSAHGEQCGLSSMFVRELFTLLLKESLRIQQKSTRKSL